MVRLSQRDCSMVLNLVGDLYSLPDATSVPATLLRHLLRIIPAEFGGCHLINHRERRVVPFYEPMSSAYPCFHRDFLRLAASHPLTPPLMMGNSRAWKVTDVTTAGAFRRTDFYNVLYRPIGIQHELVSMLPLAHDPQSFLTVSLHRRRRDFSERDRALFNLVLPHLAKVQRRLSANRSECAVANFPSAEQLAATLQAKTTWPLNPREIEVLFWLAQGKSNAEIGKILGISARTAETHALHSYPKMGVENRYGAIVELMTLAKKPSGVTTE